MLNLHTCRRVFLALSAVLAFAVASPVLAKGHAAAKLETLVITTTHGPVRFKVEVVDNDATRERGLMFRKSMPADHGMLFDFKTEQPVLMWMKVGIEPRKSIMV